MHTLNTVKKRLEPTQTKCQYCKIESSSHMEDNYFVPLYKENDRTNIIVYRSVKYSKVPIGIPRCKNCLEIHKESATKSTIISWCIAVAIVIISFIVWGPFGFFSIFAGIFIGFYGAELLENKLVRDKGIDTKLDGAKQNGTVQDFVINGWSFKMPTA